MRDAPERGRDKRFARPAGGYGTFWLWLALALAIPAWAQVHSNFTDSTAQESEEPAQSLEKRIEAGLAEVESESSDADALEARLNGAGDASH